MDICKVFLVICPVFIAVNFALYIYKIRQRSEEENELRERLNIENPKNENIKKLGVHIFKNRRKRYENIKIYLSKMGVYYHQDRVIDPMEWIILKSVLGIVFFLMLLIVNLPAALIGMIIGYCLPNIVVSRTNSKDNKEMLSDIMNIYMTLKIKTEAGMFLTDSIMQCYKVAKNGRLKAGLLTLVGEINTKNNVPEALEHFELQFKNRYISSFSGVIRQSFETGDALNAIDNISKQISAVQKAMDIDRENKMDADIMIVQTMILVELMVIVAYGMVKMMMSMVSIL